MEPNWFSYFFPLSVTATITNNPRLLEKDSLFQLTGLRVTTYAPHRRYRYFGLQSTPPSLRSGGWAELDAPVSP